jgi:hypothetical protein
MVRIPAPASTMIETSAACSRQVMKEKKQNTILTRSG